MFIEGEATMRKKGEKKKKKKKKKGFVKYLVSTNITSRNCFSSVY